LTPSGDLVYRNLIGFVRVLRHEGFAVTTMTTEQLASAGRLVGFHRYVDVREAFRSIAASTQAQSERFDELFESFFTGDVVISLDTVLDSFKQRRSMVNNPRNSAETKRIGNPRNSTKSVEAPPRGRAAPPWAATKSSKLPIAAPLRLCAARHSQAMANPRNRISASRAIGSA
jgi:uncharacterized protein with von Willebrand factor type A (vWA) domain